RWGCNLVWSTTENSHAFHNSHACYHSRRHAAAHCRHQCCPGLPARLRLWPWLVLLASLCLLPPLIQSAATGAARAKRQRPPFEAALVFLFVCAHPGVMYARRTRRHQSSWPRPLSNGGDLDWHIGRGHRREPFHRLDGLCPNRSSEDDGHSRREDVEADTGVVLSGVHGKSPCLASDA